ncbi:MAG TPA: hypothetical protein VFG20_15600 [Planctomycetaceae bacterium]|jgi:hypothetical protein|nr:hypothetical protein [Planctomycetaceae bacterium]
MATLEEIFPVSLQERPLRYASTEVNPATLLRAELTRVAGVHRERCDQLLVSLATTWFQLSRLAADSAVAGANDVQDRLDIVLANLHDELRSRHVEVHDLTGRTFVANDQPLVDVRGSRPNPELTEPVVWHMEQPVIMRGDRCLMRGVVILETPQRS